MLKRYLILLIFTLFMASVAIAKPGTNDGSTQKLIRLFQELITTEATGDEKLRQTEFAIRLLTALPDPMGKNIAYSIATNSHENAMVRKIAFEVGLEIDPGWFSEKILQSMNIVLATKNNRYDTEQAKKIRRKLTDQHSGYPALVKRIFDLLSGNRLHGVPTSLATIHDLNEKTHSELKKPIKSANLIETENLKRAVLDAWNRHNQEQSKDYFESTLAKGGDEIQE